MLIMGLDISSKSTGWAIIEYKDNKCRLIKYDKINPVGTLTHAQKLCLFQSELNRLINEYKPNHIAIEDVVHVNSRTVLKILARLNGIGILEAYKYLKEDPVLYKPTEWKKCLPDCKGNSKKCEVQTSILNVFDLLDQKKIKELTNQIEVVKNSDKSKKEKDKEYKKISKDVYIRTAINDDIADAIGVAYTYILKEIEK